MQPVGLTPEEARADLDAVWSQRERAVARAKTPGWYHPLLGLCLGSIVASVATHSTAVILPVEALALVGMGILVAAYRRSTGIWVSSIQGPATKRVIAYYVASLGAVAVTGLAFDALLDIRGAWVAGGVLVGVGVVVIGNRWDVAFAADLTHQPDDRA